MTPLESALGCHDILATIFDHLAPGRPNGDEKTEDVRRSCRMALASVALTCSTLSHYALNALWREIDSIHPLLRTLPNCKRVDSQIILCGAISDEDWTRFRMYADRVRAIAASFALEQFLDPIHPSVWAFLGARCNGSAMIPRLHYLFSVDLHLSEIPAIVLLLSPSLRTLDILFAAKEEEDRQIAPDVVNSLLRTLPLMAPNLETLSCELGLRLGHGYIEEFRRFARLKMLEMHSEDALDGGALQRLSAIGTLQRLTCTIDRSSSSLLTLHPYVFPHLTRLNVAGPFDDLTAFTKACLLPSLTGLILRVKEPPSAGKPADSFAAICRRFNPALLTSFTAAIRYAFTSESPRPSCLLQYFEPVLAFPNIKCFHLSFSPAIPSIRDDDLARCGAAWQHLSSFRVSHLAIGQDAPDDFVRPTLSGLVDFARRCPHLETFQIPELDASATLEKTASLPLEHGLGTLLLNSIVLPAPGSALYSEVATVFDRVFPSIDLEDALSITLSRKKEFGDFLGLLGELRRGRAGG